VFRSERARPYFRCRFKPASGAPYTPRRRSAGHNVFFFFLIPHQFRSHPTDGHRMPPILHTVLDSFIGPFGRRPLHRPAGMSSLVRHDPPAAQNSTRGAPAVTGGTGARRGAP
jgi:hypothetical protein